MKQFVWTDHHSFLVVAHAETVDRGRVIALREIGTTDGSCPNRQKVREWIIERAPTIWRGENAGCAIEEGATDTEPGTVFFS